LRRKRDPRSPWRAARCGRLAPAQHKRRPARSLLPGRRHAAHSGPRPAARGALKPDPQSPTLDSRLPTPDPRSLLLHVDHRYRPARRHPTAGPPARRCAAPLRGRRDVRAHRADPPDLHALWPPRRSGRRPPARPAAEEARPRRHRQRGARVLLLLAPGQPGRRPAAGARAAARPAGGRAAARQPGADGGAAGHSRRHRGAHPRAAARRLPDAGAHRPPHRSAAQEHPGHRARDCPSAGRQRRRGTGGRGAQRAPGRADRNPVADTHAAAGEAHGGRRDRQRAVVLAGHFPDPGSGAVRRPGAPPRRGHARRPGARPPVPAPGQLDRRRPRRPPARRRTDHASRARRAGGRGAEPLSARGPPAGQRAVDLGAAAAGRGGAAAAGRRQPRPRWPPPAPTPRRIGSTSPTAAR